MMDKWGQIPIYNSEDDLCTRIVRTGFVILGSIFIVSGWYYTFISHKKSIDGSPRIYAEKLHKDFLKIPTPENVSTIDEVGIHSKYASALVSQSYLTLPLAYDVIYVHYDVHLKRNGWSYMGHFHGGTNGIEKYCKEDAEASIMFHEYSPGGPLGYGFSMYWEGRPCTEKIKFVNQLTR